MCAFSVAVPFVLTRTLPSVKVVVAEPEFGPLAETE